MDYRFKGTIFLQNNNKIPFVIDDGLVSFSISSKSALPMDSRGVVLSGVTEDKRTVNLLISHFYECGYNHFIRDNKEHISVPHIEGVIEACIVLDSGNISDINSIGFYSLVIPEITGRYFSGYITDKYTLSNNKEILGEYLFNGANYKVSIGFVENEPCSPAELIELKTNKCFSIETIRDSYWLMKKMFTFLFQKVDVPMECVYLRSNEKNVGKLFIEHMEHQHYFLNHTRCIRMNVMKDNFSNLLQLIADQKVYLRHVPMYKEEENSYSAARLLMALVGLENTLDSLGVHCEYNNDHLETIEKVKGNIKKLADDSTGKEKKIYKRFLHILEKDDSLESRLLVALTEDEKYINTFFPLESLGDIATIAKDLSQARNDLAHGNLDFNLNLKSGYQMVFLMRYILYLQLKMIGLEREEASEATICFHFGF